jgi:hypothetical protein
MFRAAWSFPATNLNSAILRFVNTYKTLNVIEFDSKAFDSIHFTFFRIAFLSANDWRVVLEEIHQDPCVTFAQNLFPRSFPRL